MHSKLLAIPLAIAISACGQMPSLTPTVQVPDKIKGAANESLAMIAAAKGVQIYECRASKDAGTADWAFVAPEAELFDGKPSTAARSPALRRSGSTRRKPMPFHGCYSRPSQ